MSASFGDSPDLESPGQFDKEQRKSFEPTSINPEINSTFETTKCEKTELVIPDWHHLLIVHLTFPLDDNAICVASYCTLLRRASLHASSNQEPEEPGSSSNHTLYQ